MGHCVGTLIWEVCIISPGQTPHRLGHCGGTLM